MRSIVSDKKVLGNDGSAEWTELRRRMMLVVVVVWERGWFWMSYFAERRVATGVFPGRFDVSYPFIFVSVNTLLGNVFSPNFPNFSYAHHNVGLISSAFW